MAESFKNFSVKSAVTNRDSIVLVPSSVTDGSITPRESGTSAQIHSIYLSMVASSRIRGINRYNPSNFIAFDLCVETVGNASKKSHIVHDGRIVPGAPFFIEKNVTLEPDQKLVIYCPGDAYEYNSSDPSSDVLLNTNSSISIEASASAVLLPVIG